METLTPREREVLRVLARGVSNADIGRELFISENTVKLYVSRILRKLEAGSRTAAVARAYQLGLVGE